MKNDIIYIFYLIKMRQYLDLLKTVLETGDVRDGRNGSVHSIFGYQMRFDLSKGLPIVTTKKINVHAVIHELIWFLRGDTNVRYLEENNVKIWSDWADENGDLGPIYSSQWTSWLSTKYVLNKQRLLEEELNQYKSNVNLSSILRDNNSVNLSFDLNDNYKDNNKLTKSIDQIQNVINQIKTDPYSRRLIVSAWNVDFIEDMALPPCHTMFQFYVSSINGKDVSENNQSNKRKLSCQLYQRSGDVFLGIPFNIASYSILTHIIAHLCDLEVGEFIHTIGDAHLYSNHISQAKLQLTRETLPLPSIKILCDKNTLYKDIKYEDIQISNYQHHSFIKADISI
jgi:thymidylate synthase